MVDEFMVCVDRIISSAARFQESPSSGDQAQCVTVNVVTETQNSGGEGCSLLPVRECRICQEEDDEKYMEAPCACNGTLKFAHRKCIQRWCNKKGNITCEICSQVFSPNYTYPSPRNNADVMTIDISSCTPSEYEQFAIANSGTLTCFLSLVIILMLLLLVRQTLIVTRDFRILRESSVFFHYQISVLQLAGFLLPCYVVARSWYFIQCRRRQG